MPGVDCDLLLTARPSTLPETLLRRGRKQLRPRTPEQVIVAETYVEVCIELCKYAPDPKTGLFASEEQYHTWATWDRAHDVLCDIVDRIEWEGT